MGNSDVVRYGISSIFSSIQGEGMWIGTRASFIRFATCNLTCPWCDTSDLSVNAELTLQELIDYGSWHDHIILTGGEPSIQPGISELITAFTELEHMVHVETNGSRATVNHADWVTVSPKAELDYIYSPGIKPDELKYVVTRELKPEHIEVSRYVDTWLMPQDGWEGSLEKALDLLHQVPGAKLGIQAHKYWRIA